MNAATVAVAVVGSVNLDLVARTDRAPEAGETVLGTHFSTAEGGKGGNQAVAAAAHATTAFIGCVGDDDAGRRLRAHLDRAGVRTDLVRTGAEPSGHALITVAGDGENRIVVVPGANRELTADHVEAALDTLRPVAVLAQLEIPLEAVIAAARWTRAHGATFLLNPSPVRELPAELIDLVDVLLVNLGEARAIAEQTGAPPTAAASAAELADALRTPERSVVVTAGSRGVALAMPGTATVHIAAEPVAVVDTTGAGDAFAGALVGRIASGIDLERCVREANAVAARVVAIPRAQR